MATTKPLPMSGAPRVGLNPEDAATASRAVYTKPLKVEGYKPAPVAPNGYKPSANLQSFAELAGLKGVDELAFHFPPGANLKDIDDGMNNLAGVTQANAGIYNTPQQGLQEIGVGRDGRKIYADPILMKNPTDYGTGGAQLSTIGKALDMFGAFKEKNDANGFLKYAKTASDPKFLGNLTAQISTGDTKGAVNAILQQFGKPALDGIVKDKQDRDGLTTGFAAMNLVTNWDKMNNSQRSMAISGLALKAYKFADGTDLSKKVLIGSSTPGGPQLTVGGALGLVGTGMNVNDLIKNWGQLDAVQRLTYGLGTAAQLANTGRQFGLIGNGTSTGTSAAAGGLSAASLVQAGFKSIPSAGVGAVVGPQSALPSGYTAIGDAGNGSVIAVPSKLTGTTAAGNGTSATSILNAAAGVASVGLAANRVYRGWGKGGTDGAANGLVGGTQMAAGLAQLGESNPYLLGGMVAASVLGNIMPKGTATTVVGAGAAGVAAYSAATNAASGAGAAAGANTLGAVAAGAGALYSGSKILGSDLSNEQKAQELRYAAGSAAAAYYTVGLSALAEAADQQFLGGKIGATSRKYDKYIPANRVIDAGLVGVMKLTGSSKGKHQVARDMVRKHAKEIGLTDEKLNVTLADGSKFNIEIDGGGGKHEFRFPEKVPPGGEVRSLNAYDIDYTNDLDQTAGIATIGLMRLLSGGKGQPIDQMGSQLANAAIANVGFGQDLTEENFAKVQANLRGFYTKAGLGTKEDAYALANQMFAEERITEMDLIATHHGINLAFDDDGYDSAQTLMAGRFKGVAVANDLPAAPGPNMNFKMPDMPAYTKPLQVSAPPGSPMAMASAATNAANNEPIKIDFKSTFDWDGGGYWKAPGRGNYDLAESEWDPATGTPTVKVGEAMASIIGSSKNMTKEELRKFNAGKFGSA